MKNIKDIEYWNVKKDYNTREERKAALHGLMMRSESGRALIEEEKILKRMEVRNYSIEDYYVSKLSEMRRKHEKRDIRPRDVPFASALRQYLTGDISSELREMSQEIRMKSASYGTQAGIGLMYPIETRTISVTGTNGVTVGEEVFDLLGAIRNKLVLNKAGATFLTGLKGNVSFITYQGSTVFWDDEAASAKNGQGDFSKTVLSPKRLTAYVDISKQMLLQENARTDKFIINDFAQAIASVLQAAILGNHEHSDIKPDGIFTGADLCMTGNADYKNIALMQSEVYDSGINYCYITNNKGYAKLKSTLKVKDTAEGFVVERFKGESYNSCADWPLYVTDDIPEIEGEHGIAFGDFSELIIGQWGDLDITVDPFTQATSGMIRLVVNCWFDAVVRRSNAVAVGSFS